MRGVIGVYLKQWRLKLYLWLITKMGYEPILVTERGDWRICKRAVRNLRIDRTGISFLAAITYLRKKRIQYVSVTMRDIITIEPMRTE